MRLDQLFNSIPGALILAGTDTEVTGVHRDSRAVGSGDLFVCLEGATTDGHLHVTEALQRGARGVVARAGRLAPSDLPAGTPLVTLPDPGRELAAIASRLYGNPSATMLMVGVTGTNGKTTVTRMIASILRASGLSVGVIGTLGADLDGRAFDSELTTPQADDLQRLLAAMRDAGAVAVAMEVSSHALDLRRTDNIAFNAAVLTNISPDHLDYHGTMEAYFAAKERLFAEYPLLFPRPDGAVFVSVINVSQWEGREMVTRARGDVITFATRPEDPAVLRPDGIRIEAGSTQFTARYDSGTQAFEFPVSLPLGGAFQVGNALAAIGVALRLDIPVEQVQHGLACMQPVPGRFEAVPTGDLGFSVLVDYAHTPDGLENVLASARALGPARLGCVFGCGGDRDRTKRPVMGRIASEMADYVIVTSDNPRTEDPEEIIREIAAGIPESGAPAEIQPDRRLAIQSAIASARAGDVVVIAGKGHEDYQIIGRTKYPFDDREVAGEAIRDRMSAANPCFSPRNRSRSSSSGEGGSPAAPQHSTASVGGALSTPTEDRLEEPETSCNQALAAAAHRPTGAMPARRTPDSAGSAPRPKSAAASEPHPAAQWMKLRPGRELCDPRP